MNKRKWTLSHIIFLIFILLFVVVVVMFLFTIVLASLTIIGKTDSYLFSLMSLSNAMLYSVILGVIDIGIFVLSYILFVKESKHKFY